MSKARCTVAVVVIGVALLGQVEDAVPGGIVQAQETRKALITRAKVWLPTEITSKNLLLGPQEAGAFQPGETLTCDYTKKLISGASPKFHCKLANGDVLKVKYGGANGEVFAEVAASRLLWSLGFGADRMYSVKVICRGCPENIGGILRRNGDRIIDPAAVERKMPGRELSGEWSWKELNDIDEAKGGATPAERDAFKLLAAFLQHTDNKPVQQRLTCAEPKEGEEGGCAVPLMMINDLGLTFGHANTFNSQNKGSMHLEAWSRVHVWKSGSTCVATLDDSITGTMFDPKIGEEGRAFLAGLLAQLTDQQLRDMFTAARVQLRVRNPLHPSAGFPTVDEWVNAFKKKRAEIVDRHCET